MTQLRPALVLFGLLALTAALCRGAACGRVDPYSGDGGASGSGVVNRGRQGRADYGAGCSPNLCDAGFDDGAAGSAEILGGSAGGGSGS